MLDLIRLGDDRWLARAIARHDGRTIVLEEVLVCREMPLVEAVLELTTEPPVLVLRDREVPAMIYAHLAVDDHQTTPQRAREPRRSMSVDPAPSTAMT